MANQVIDKITNVWFRENARIFDTLGHAKSVFLDKRFLGGVIVGLGLLAGGYVLSNPSASSSSSSSADPSSTLLTSQTSVIITQMQNDAANCAAAQPGTLGEAINNSLQAHLQLAVAMPNVEQLFNVDNNCFSQLNSIIDLSFAIPSLQSFITAAENAVINYAKKQICSAVSQTTSMVTTPINQALITANGYIGNINGMTANLNSGGGIATIDPNLGANFNIGATGTYTTNQPSNQQSQAIVNPSTGANSSGSNSSSSSSGSSNTSGGTNGSLAGLSQVEQLDTQIGNLNSQVSQVQDKKEQDTLNMEICLATAADKADCTPLIIIVENDNKTIDSLNSQITAIQNQINSITGIRSSSSTSSTSQTSTSGADFSPGTSTSQTSTSGAAFSPGTSTSQTSTSGAAFSPGTSTSQTSTSGAAFSPGTSTSQTSTSGAAFSPGTSTSQTSTSGAAFSPGTSTSQTSTATNSGKAQNLTFTQKLFGLFN